MVTLDTVKGISAPSAIVPDIKNGIQRSIKEIEEGRKYGINTVGMLGIIRNNVLIPYSGETLSSEYQHVQDIYVSELKSAERAASSSINTVLNRLSTILGNP